MSRTLSLEVKLVEVVLCKLSASGCVCQGRASRLAELPAPASAAGGTGRGAGDEDAGCPALPHPSLLCPCRGDARQPNGQTRQPRLARRCPLWPSVCSPSSHPARPGQRLAVPAPLLQSKMFTYSPAFLQQLESRLEYRKHDIICLLPAQDRLGPL